MKFAYDIPGYAQGHRFSDESMFYDSVNQRFYDLAGGDRFGNYVSKVNGTPTFNSRGANSRRGLFLHGSNHWQFPHACPWHGSGLIVAQFKPTETTSQFMYPWLFHEDTSNMTSGPFIGAYFYYNDRRLWIQRGAAQNQNQPNFSQDAIMILAWSGNQQTRVCSITLDGVTLTNATSAYSSTTNGNYIGMAGQPRVRLGDLAGNKVAASVTTGSLHVFEQHFWNADILHDYLSDTKAFIDTLKAYYAIS